VRPTILLLLACLSLSGRDLPAQTGGSASLLSPLAARTRWLGAPARVADGVDLFRVDGFHTSGPDAPQSVRLLRLDPTRVRLASALATNDIPGRARVLDIARRSGAIAAINAGFFSPAGEPVGLLRVDGRLVSDTRRFRGAVAVLDDGRGVRLRFGQATARVRLHFRVDRTWRVVPIDGVDTLRTPGRLVLYTPASGATTGTTGGREWTIRPASGPNGTRVWRASPPSMTGDTPIPVDGYVLSRHESVVPASLAALPRATAMRIQEAIVVHGDPRPDDWQRAAVVIGGAGLLMRDGRQLTAWAREQLSKGFDTTRHPRTVVGRGRDGAIWLITVDGRQPGRAVGMTFVELQDLLGRLDVTDALNLDGGGSTTMVAGGQVVNRPSDLTGPRAVSDALLVTPR
jgi:exopolysaccharide biosynthesis protein